MDCKVGDIVHVRGAVTEISKIGGKPFFLMDFDVQDKGARDLYLPTDAIVLVEPRPIAVGDTVQFVDYALMPWPRNAPMKVHSVVGGRAWCQSEGGYDYIIEVEKLERVS